MKRTFDLEMTDLNVFDFGFEELSNEDCEKVAGGMSFDLGLGDLKLPDLFDFTGMSDSKDGTKVDKTTKSEDGYERIYHFHDEKTKSDYKSA